MKKTAILLGTVVSLCTSLSYAQTVSYEESFQDFPNPERGFYRALGSGFSSDFKPLTPTKLINNRKTSYTPSTANYQIRNTLVFRYYVLDNFRNSSISTEYLDNIRQDLTTIREAGVKIIIRFAYDVSGGGGDGCPSGTACPPYGDASKQRILGHIAQLAPIFKQYYDVISVVQMGFIGIWGEQYYTDFFGDISRNTSQDRLLDDNWKDRLEVLDAVLEAVPKSRMVQVRYPQIKQKAIYGIDAPVTTEPMTKVQAHNGSNLARIGFHNDCFLSSADDIGTYYDYGTSDSRTGLAIDELKPYFAQDGRYTVIGGETCNDGFSPQNDCDGMAVDDMRRLHYSYLNANYNNDVNNDWQTGGCIDEIKRNLGYRLVMDQGNYANQAAPGGSMNFSLNLRNVGFAAPYNPRPVELVLRNTTSGSTYKVPFAGDNADPRFWFPEEDITLSESLTLPTSIPAGDYELLINLPDTSNNNIIANRPEYAIQLANKDTWEPATGYNRLNHTLTVSGGAPVSDATGETGQVTVYQTNTNQWETVSLTGSYNNPVIIMGPLSYNGTEPANVRVRNVTSSSFQYQIDEWDYLDGGHISETAGYMVVEAGTHDLGNGQTMIAGTRTVGTGFTTVSHQELGQDPVVLTQVTTVNESAAVITRLRNVGASSFQVRLREEEGASDGGSHANETVAWVAVSSGSGNAGRAYGALRTGESYRQDFKSLSFNASFAQPVLLANIQSYNGGDPTVLRYSDLSSSSVSLKLEEETSRDSEVSHALESVGVLVFAGNGPISAQSSSNDHSATITVDGSANDWASIAALATANGSITSLKAHHKDGKLYLLVQGDIGANNQFYLNVDNNAATGYGRPLRWNDMGADYLIENNTLFSYDGDGSSFTWSPVANNGGMVLRKTSTLVELEVPLASLENLSAALRVGYADLDGTFSFTTKVPTSSSMALYRLGENARFASTKGALSAQQEWVPDGEELQVYPNPGHDLVTITYQQAQSGPIQLEVYDLAGRLEKVLVREEGTVGQHSVQFDVQTLASGVHIVRFKSNGRVITKKLVVRQQ